MEVYSACMRNCVSDPCAGGGSASRENRECVYQAFVWDHPGAYIQGTYINISYGNGVLDGGAIAWDQYTTYAIIDTIVWIICIALPFVLGIFVKKYAYQIILAVPSLLSGIPFKRETSFNEYLDQIWDDHSVLKTVSDQGYDVRAFSDPDFYSPKASSYVKNIQEGSQTVSSYTELGSKIYKLTAFRFAPYLLKRYFWMSSQEFDDVKESHLSYKENDPAFHKGLIDNGDKPYVLGTELDFGMNATANKYCIDGFGNTSGFLTRLGGPQAIIEMPIKNLPKKGELQANFEVGAVYTKQDFRILANGKEVFSATKDESDTIQKKGIHFTMDVKDVFADSRDKLTLTFEFYSLPESEMEKKIGGRTRTIGLTTMVIDKK